jgi:hypothetical protein
MKYYNFTTLDKQDYIQVSNILDIKNEQNKNNIIDWNENIDFKLLVEKLEKEIKQ